VKKLSIITVTLNAEKMILKTLENIKEIKNLYGDEIEYLVIDGKSSDRTLEFLYKYYKEKVIDYYVSEKDKGIYDAMNKGIRASSGEYVLILGAGDVFIPSKMAKVLDKIKIYNPDIIYGDNVIVNLDTKKISRLYSSGKFNVLKIKTFGWLPPHTSIIAKKKLMEEFNYFDEKYSIAADIKLNWQIFMNSRKIIYINEILSIFPSGGESSNIIEANKQCYKIAKELSFKFPAFVIINKLIWKYSMVLKSKILTINDDEVKRYLSKYLFD